MKRPTRELIDKITSRLQTAEHVRLFFRGLRNPAWIEPLADAGFFEAWPEPVEAGGYVQHPVWPQAEYLARMAAQAPEAVASLIYKIETRNRTIQASFMQAASQMPHAIATRLVPRVVNWMRQPGASWVSDKAPALIEHLVRGGQVQSGFQLAAALFEVLPDPRTEGAEKPRWLHPRASSRLEIYEYRELLKETVSPLAEFEPMRTLEFLANRTWDALTVEGRSRGGDDYSAIWFHNLDSVPHLLDLKDVLAYALVRTADQVVARHPDLLASVVELLERYPSAIFRRAAARLIVRADASQLAAPRLTEDQYLGFPGTQRELQRLLRNFFGRLETAHQESIAQYLLRPPNTDYFAERYKEAKGELPPESELERYRRARIRDRLAAIGDQLRSPLSEYYKGLVAEFGEPEPEQEPITAYVGPTSPLTREQMTEMSIDDIVAYLREWRPSAQEWTPSPLGLARALQEVVAERSAAFVAAASDLVQGVHPTYISHVLTGLEQAVQKGERLDWGAVLGLLEFVVSQERGIVSPSIEVTDPFDIEESWGPARLNAARLIGAGVNANGPKFRLRTRVWTILVQLLGDPDPTLEHEAQYGGDNMDPPTLAINSVRGTTMRSVVLYGLWCARHLRPDDPNLERPLLDELEEVGRVVDEHLDPSRDPSVAVRSVYGWYFPWLLLLLSPAWAAQNVDRIFPEDPEQVHLRRAAWEAYVGFCAVYSSVFALLEREYLWGIQDVKSGEREGTETGRRLASHIAVIYLTGLAGLEQEQSPVRAFFSESRAAVRATAIAFLGRSMHSWEEQPKAAVVERLMGLWQWRVEVLGGAPVEERVAELREFGDWFGAGGLPMEWQVRMLRETVRLTGGEIETLELFPRLEAASTAFPLEVTEIVSQIVDRAGPFDLHGLLEHAGPILANALQAGTQERAAAVELHDKLLKRGIHKFRYLFT